MKTIAVLAGALALTASLHAGTSYILDFNTEQDSKGLAFDSGYAVSPYTGTVGGATVQLYCDDFSDNINYGQQNITAYATALSAGSALIKADTRYGVHDAPNNPDGYTTSGTTLYEEMAWLATQMQNTGTASSATNNNLALQEAIWDLTNDSKVNDGASPNTSGETGFSTTQCKSGNCDTAAAQSAATWIKDAVSYVNAFHSSATGAGTDGWASAGDYAALNTNDWFIVTAVSSAGCTVGGYGTYGCNGTGGAPVAGSTGTGTVTQEFLAYSAAGLTTTQNGSGGAVPEPASFFLIGSGLVAGALFGRRRRSSKSNS